MDSSDNVGSVAPDRQFVRDADLLRGKLDLQWKLDPRGFAILAKAISKGDSSIENSILRCWGVWG